MSEEQEDNPEETEEASEEQSEDSADAAANDDTNPENSASTRIMEEPGVPRVYDFSHPQHRLNKPLAGLIISANKVAKELSSRIDNEIHIQCTTQLISAELCKHKDIASQMRSGSCIFQLDLKPVADKGSIVMEPSLIFAMVQSFFGGTENYVYEEKPRAISTTEFRLASRLRDCILTSLSSIWGDVMNFNNANADMVTTEQFAADGLKTPVVARLKYQLLIASQTASFDVLFPYEAINYLQSGNSGGPTGENSLWAAGLQRQIVGCELDVHGVLAETDITVSQLLKLQTGDFIPLGNIQSATFSTGNTPLFEAVIGASNGRVSASISHWLGQKESTGGGVQ
ncbi:hypothetical protein AB833_21820 [Chromatiales bacterium (ex Bugula neritina AB1)]|nr:hypothetical protein AB833_21820 [Chromatiales bacterium (ex Bugula neritina AB1)]